MSESTMKILNLFSFPAKLHKASGQIFDTKDRMMGNIRGYGKIQQIPDSENPQGTLGQFIVDAINEKWEKTNEKKVL